MEGNHFHLQANASLHPIVHLLRHCLPTVSLPLQRPPLSYGCHHWLSVEVSLKLRGGCFICRKVLLNYSGVPRNRAGSGMSCV